MTDLYDQHIDEMKSREREDMDRIAFRQHLQDTQAPDNYSRLAAYKRKRAMVEIQRLGQEIDGATP